MGSSVYKKLEKDCRNLKIDGSDEACTSIQVLSLPETNIEQTMDKFIFSNNNKRMERNKYLDTLNFDSISIQSGEYFKKYGTTFRKHDQSKIKMSFNDIIEHIPNFVYTFDNGVTEPYTEISNSTPFTDVMFFDFLMIQTALKLYNKKMKVIPGLCLLKCDQVVHEEFKIGDDFIMRPPSQFRLCLTPDSFQTGANNSFKFFKNFLKTVTFEGIDDLDEVKHNLKFLRSDEAPDDFRILSLLKLVSMKYLYADNIYRVPVKISSSNLMYFNVVFPSNVSKKSIQQFKNYVKANKIINLTSKTDVQRMGFEKLPFNFLFYESLNIKNLTIDPEFIEGPYIVKYNHNKKFKKLKHVTFNLVSSYVDPKFFKMLERSSSRSTIYDDESSSDSDSDYDDEDSITYSFISSRISNIANITLYSSGPRCFVIIKDTQPNFIWDIRAIKASRLTSITFKYDSQTIDESSSIDLSLIKIDAFLNLEYVDLYIDKFYNITYPETFRYLNPGNTRLMLKFINCNITSFHPSLFTSYNLRLIFDNCNLSNASIRSLRANLPNIPQNLRPSIQIRPENINFENIVTEHTLPEIVDLIFQLNQRGNDKNKPKFENLTCNPYLSRWLSRIYRESSTTIIRQLTPHIIEMLIEMDHNQEFMEEACNIIQDATSTCGDRMILSILYVSLQFKMHILSNNLTQVNEIVNFMVRGPFIMSELEKIARNKIGTLNIVDPLEVFLAYPIKLRDRFNIPIETRDMLYYSCSSIETKDLNAASEIIETKLRDKSLIANFLSTQPLWTKVIHSKFPDIYDDLDTLQDNLIRETSKIISEITF